MEVDRQEEGKRDWTGYGSAQRPIIIMCYHVQDKVGVHRLLSINDHALRELHGDREGFEWHLGERYRWFELVGSCKGIVDLAQQTATFEAGAHELKRRCQELRAKHGEMSVEPWMPEPTDQQKPDKTAPTPATTASTPSKDAAPPSGDPAMDDACGRFGACPVCHRDDGYINVGADHWFVCLTHKKKWCAGANLFSSAMEETPRATAAGAGKVGI
jgi:hypothetical protein